MSDLKTYGPDEFDVMRIMDKIPHRAPFLLIDRIVSFQSMQCIEAILRTLTEDSPVRRKSRGSSCRPVLSGHAPPLGRHPDPAQRSPHLASLPAARPIAFAVSVGALEIAHVVERDGARVTAAAQFGTYGVLRFVFWRPPASALRCARSARP